MKSDQKLDQITKTLRGEVADCLPFLSPTEAQTLQTVLPPGLRPFMKEQQAGWDDIYAIDLRDDSIVIWADHAVVQKWETIDAFAQWLKQEKDKKG